jgi:hypothetical protein
MGISKVYRGYVIEQMADNQWYIRNAPSWTNMNAFSPGPHPNWSVATHQVDKLVEYTNRSNDSNSGWSTKSNGGEQYTNRSSSSSDDPSFFQVIFILGLFVLMGYLITA